MTVSRSHSPRPRETELSTSIPPNTSDIQSIQAGRLDASGILGTLGAARQPWDSAFFSAHLSVDLLGLGELELQRTRTPDKFTEQDLGPLVDFIKSDVKIVHLDLSNHDLGKREMQCLLRSLHGLPQLERIDLMGNKMPAVPQRLLFNLLKSQALRHLLFTLETPITSEVQLEMFRSDLKAVAKDRIEKLALTLSSDSVGEKFLVPVTNTRVPGKVDITVAE
jgi:hypothetical protein